MLYTQWFDGGLLLVRYCFSPLPKTLASVALFDSVVVTCAADSVADSVVDARC